MQTLRIPKAPQNRQLDEPEHEVAFAFGSRRRGRPFAGSRVLRIEGSNERNRRHSCSAAPRRPGLHFSGTCPSVAKIDFWPLAQRVRLELGDKVEFMALHPRLCEEDGKRLMRRFLTPSIQVITPASGGKRQEKLLRERREKEATHV